MKPPHSGSAAVLKKECCVRPGSTEKKMRPQTCTVDSVSAAFIQFKQIWLEYYCIPLFYVFLPLESKNSNCGGCGVSHV